MKFAGAYVDEETHKALKKLAKSEHRTLADQCRLLFEKALSGEIKVPKKKKASNSRTKTTA